MKESTIENNKKICLIFPTPTKGEGFFYSQRIIQLIELIKGKGDSYESKIYALTNLDVVTIKSLDNLHVKIINHIDCSDSSEKPILFFLKDIISQIKISYSLLKIIHNIDVIIWKARPCTIVFPLFISNLFNKKSILLVESRNSEILLNYAKNSHNYEKAFILNFFSRLYVPIEYFVFTLVDKIAVNVPDLLNDKWINKFKNKLFPEPLIFRYISDEFEVKNPYNKREKKIGFIGRMSREKGIENFVIAIKKIHLLLPNLSFLIIGQGPLDCIINSELNEGIKEGWIEKFQWISSNEIPLYLNNLSLLIVPSFYEGSPNIILEAMACGTPVLSTPVGAVPGIIIDGKNGYIMMGNSPEIIIKNLFRVLNDTNRILVSIEGQKSIFEKYSYQSLRNKYIELIYNDQ